MRSITFEFLVPQQQVFDQSGSLVLTRLVQGLDGLLPRMALGLFAVVRVKTCLC